MQYGHWLNNYCGNHSIYNIEPDLAHRMLDEKTINSLTVTSLVLLLATSTIISHWYYY